MKKVFLVLPAAFFVLGSMGYCKAHSSNYQMGTYVTANTVTVPAGIQAGNFDCDPQTQGSIACSGKTNSNGVTWYRIQVDNGFWILKARHGSYGRDSLGEAPVHLTAKEQNPLDRLKNGDKVLFRVETHRRLNGIETDIDIPYADNPDKEARFPGTFTPAAISGQSKTRSNIRALCDAHKLSPELEKQYCTQP
ncbi:MAG: hypothetical protein ABI076_08630 [Acidobacteriaceae bacterium]